jgi:hypothetical protein
VDKEMNYLKAGFLDSTFNVSKASVKLTGAGVMSRNGTYAPLMYMISTRIDGPSIDLMLNHLKIMCPGFEPTVFFTDKDLALGNAIKQNYPLAHHRLCFVHVNGTLHFICINYAFAIILVLLLFLLLLF